MRADRLIAILLALQNRGRMTSRELADRLEVSERTIHRDMEALSAAGIPVVAERGSHGGWTLREGYRTNLTGMKSGEMKSLMLAHPSGLVQDLGLRGAFDDAFQKLLAAFPVSLHREAELVRQRIHIDGAGWRQHEGQLPFLSLIQEAVWDERRLRIRYKREEDYVERILDPLGLVAKGSIWYLIASVENSMRTYRISRLTDAAALNETFERPESFDLAAYWEESTAAFRYNLPRYPARLRLKERTLQRLAAQWYVNVLHSSPVEDDCLEADIEFRTLESACEILLGHGRNIYIIEPPELKQRVLEEARAITAQYE
ncbi:helix-turn-helix transcriptional regulator [Paenibacillus lutrae]|uniref:WYL domain-containing protein n=1 Tax=Paenibacillus lutrae TaxID=2078573 RepID=A0A7X3JXN5_9BACL|nr:YafY family protein [Paenibacillus lutrae]MVO98070.1 WYL domain-containing protein [Paenibacillus lutrae]